MTLTISAAQVASFIANPSSFSGYSAGSHVIISGAISHTQATSLNSVDATYIQATVSETTIANLTAISVDNSSRSSLNKFSFVISDTGATAAELNALQAKTSVAVDADNIGGAATGIEASSSSDITTLYTGTVPTGIADAKISVNDTTIDAATLNTINGYTTGDVTTTALTISGNAGAIETALTASGSGIVYSRTLAGANAVTVTVTDTTVDAANLVDVDALTDGLVTVSSSATSITGTLTEVQSAFTAAAAGTPTIAGLGSLNVTLDDPDTAGTQSYSVSGIHTLIDTLTGWTGKVTATVTEGDVNTLKNSTTGLTGTGHSLTVTVTDPTLTAAELNTIDAVTVLPVVLAPSKTGVAAYDGAQNDGATADRDDSKTFTEIAATGGTGSGATFTVATAADGSATITLVNPGAGYTDNDVLTIPRAGTYLGATDITVVVNGVTSTAGNAVIASSTYASALTAFQSSGVSGLSASAVTISDSISVGQANALDALTTGAITATISDNDLSTLVGLTGTGNAYTITTSDTTAAATDLNTVVGKTTVAVNMNTVGTVTGTLTDLNTLYVTNGASVSNEGDEAITVSDTAIDAALLTTLNTETSGLITLTSASSISGAGSLIEALYDDSPTTEIAGLDGDLTVTVTGDSATPTVIDADHLLAIDGDTTGLITIDSSATSLSGSYSDVHDVLTQNKTRASATDTTGVATPTISGLENLDITLTGTTTLANYLDIQNNYTTGVVSATLESRTYAQLTAETTTGTKDIVSGNDLKFVVSDTSFTTAKLTELNSMTTGTIELVGANAAVTISGTAADIRTIFDASVAEGGNGFLTSGLADANVTVSDTNVSAADLEAIRSKVTGNNQIDISAATRITGLLSDVNTILADAGTDYSGEGSELITLTDATISASALATLLANGAQLTDKTVTIVASTISGSESEVSLILDDTIQTAAGGLVKQHDVDNGNDGSTTVVGLDGINVTLSGTPTAAQVNAIALRTTGTVTATLSGTASAIAAGLTETIATTGGHALTVNLADTEVTAADLNTISGLTTGAITLDTDSGTAGNQSPAISGSVTAINTVYADSKITGASASALTVTGGISVSDLNTLAAKTTGAITATVSDGDITTLSGISETSNALSLSVTDASISATALDALVSKTTGLVNVAATSTLTGTLAEVTATLGRTTTINGVGAMKVSVTENITVAEAVALDALTTGAITATISNTDLDSLIGNGVATIDTVGNGTSANRTVGTYIIGASDYTTDVNAGSSGATFSVAVATGGVATITVLNPGQGYAVDETFTITDANLGGGGGASLTFDVATRSAGLGSGHSWVTTVANQSPENSTGTQIDTSISASLLNTLDSRTDQVVTVTAPNITGTLADITTAFNSNSPANLSNRTISGLETKAITVTDTSITQAEAQTAQALSTGVLTATVSQDDAITVDTPGAAVLTGVAAFDGAVNAGATADRNDSQTFTDIATTSSAAGTGATFKVVTAADGAATITLLKPGTGYVDNEVITIPRTGTYGGASDITVVVDNSAGGASSRIAGTYNAAATTSAGGGTGLTLNVTIAADGTASATVASGGGGYAVNETVTVADSVFGGNGAAGLTFDIATIGAVSIADFIATTTNASGVTTQNIESGNALSVVFDDASVTAADLLTAQSLTSGLITLTNAAGGATTITGTQADVKSVYALEASVVGGVAVAPGFTSIGDSPIDIRGTVGLISAADLVALNADTTGLITITPASSSITGISGSYADVHSVLTQDKHVANATTDTTGVTAPTITGLLKTSTAINAIDGLSNDGATADRVDSTTFAEIAATGGSGIGATFKVVTGADGAATVTLVNAGAGYADNEVLTIPRTGTYGGASDITVTVNGLTDGPALTVNLTGSTTVAQVNDIIDNYSSLGSLADAAAQGGIGVVTASVTETTMAELASLNTTGVAAIDGATGVGATAGRVDSTTFNDVAQASSTGSGTGATFTVVTGADGSATVTLVNRGTGYVDNEVITLDITAFDGTATTAAVTVTVNGLQNTTANLGISLSETTVAAAALNTLDTKTTGTITLASGTSLTGVLTNNGAVDTALSSTGISGIGAVNVTSTEGTNTIAEVNDISSQTTGSVTATLPTGLLSTFADINETGNAYTVNVSDTGSVAAATVNVLNGKTTGVVSLNSVTTVTGALSDLKTLYDANTAGEVTGLGNETITISDTGTLAAGDLNHINGLTTGVITATGATTISGTLSEIRAVYAAGTAGTISGLGNEAITVTDSGLITTANLTELDGFTTGTVTVSVSGSTLAASTLNSLDAESTTVVDASTVTTLTGSAADINTAYASTGISGLGNEAVTLTDTSLSASTLTTLDSKTSGSIDANSVTTLTGSTAEITSLTQATGITFGTNVGGTINDVSVSATALNALDTAAGGTVDASSVKTITGSGAAALTAFESTGISGLVFDASSYIAGYADLMAAFSSDLGAARVHYFDFGVAEGRSFDAFDEASYLASYSDLLAAFGTNTDSALIHYINNGYSEGRAVDTFDENSYLASNASLIGTVTDAAAHYVSTGYAAGLALDTFNEFSYIASYADLISAFGADGAAGTKHFVEYGSAEGRSDTFDELAYIASHSDLINAFGTDQVAGAKHYIEYGSTEGRTTTFDASSYLAAHADVRAAFGTNQELATKHYIEYGSAEGRALT